MPSEQNAQEQIDRLNRQVVELYRQGHYQQAVALAAQVCHQARQTLGESHPAYATTLDNLAELYEAEGDYARAEPLCRQSLEICRQAFGEGHHSYAARLNNCTFRDFLTNDLRGPLSS
jgi:tetratricopeptide (TPR) repeat protein